MAKLLPSPAVSILSGSIGEVTFADTRFGLVAKQKPIRDPSRRGGDAVTRDRFAIAAKRSNQWFINDTDTAQDVATALKTNPNAAYVSELYTLDKTGRWPGKVHGTLPEGLAINRIDFSPTTITIHWAAPNRYPYPTFLFNYRRLDGLFYEPDFPGAQVAYIYPTTIIPFAGDHGAAIILWPTFVQFTHRPFSQLGHPWTGILP